MWRAEGTPSPWLRRLLRWPLALRAEQSRSPGAGLHGVRLTSRPCPQNTLPLGAGQPLLSTLPLWGRWLFSTARHQACPLPGQWSVGRSEFATSRQMLWELWSGAAIVQGQGPGGSLSC